MTIATCQRIPYAARSKPNVLAWLKATLDTHRRSPVPVAWHVWHMQNSELYIIIVLVLAAVVVVVVLFADNNKGKDTTVDVLPFPFPKRNDAHKPGKESSTRREGSKGIETECRQQVTWLRLVQRATSMRIAKWHCILLGARFGGTLCESLRGQHWHSASQRLNSKLNIEAMHSAWIHINISNSFISNRCEFYLENSKICANTAKSLVLISIICASLLFSVQQAEKSRIALLIKKQRRNRFFFSTE